MAIIYTKFEGGDLEVGRTRQGRATQGKCKELTKIYHLKD
jgi:hypothetical protein